jgi:hypothetical protein
LSGARLATVAGLAVGALGIVILRQAGVAMPTVPPGLVLLIGAALLVGITGWRWTPAVGALVGLAEIIAILATGSAANLIDLSPVGVFIGTWIRALGVVTALIAGVLATSSAYRPSPSKPS